MITTRPTRRCLTHRTSRRRLAHKLGAYESLEKRLAMANNFLAGNAYFDANNNSQFDAGENYLEGATIELRSADGSTSYGTRSTDAQGAYIFTNVNPGDYKLINHSAPNYAGSSTQSLSGISTVNSSTVNSISVTLRSPTDLTAGVDMDRFANQIGIFENVQVSIDGTSITTKAGQLPAKLQGNTLSPNPSAEFLTLSTDLYHGLGSGVNGPYIVNADLNPSGSGSPQNAERVAYLYNHYGLTQRGSAADAAGLQLAVWELLYDADSLDVEGNLTSGDFSVTTASTDAILAAKFYLSDSIGKSESAIFLNDPSAPSLPATSNSTGLIVSGSYNFGNVTAAKIGDLVWHDKNINGRQESNEPRISGAIVNLYQGSTLIATTTTNSTGIYEFDHLLAGQYKVEFLMPAGFTKASPANVINNNVDNVDSDGPVTGLITLAPGQINSSIDQGFYKLAKLGDFVWNDKNGNGRQNPDEEGIENARVNLRKYDVQTDAIVVIDTTLTDNTGRYDFDDIEPGVYDVEFIKPPAYAYISPQGTEDAEFDSDGPYVSELNLESGEIEETIDQGFYGASTIGNFVWHDVNGDGFQDSTEIGINDVVVSLMQGSTQVATTHTTGGGLYSFVVAPGTYTIKFTQPAGFNNASPTDANSDDTKDSDGLTTAPVTVGSDEVINSVDMGFNNLATIGDYVWHDLNANGIQESNEPGIDGVSVVLLQGTTQVATDVTSDGGRYSFSVAPGTYTVVFTKPLEYTNVSPANVGDTNLDSDGLSVGVTVLSGETNNNIDLGLFKLITLGNYAWHDIDADGIQDSSESGINGVNIRLMQGTTEVATAVTTNGGLYSFNVAPGTYTLEFLKPAGYSKTSYSNVVESIDRFTFPATTLASGDVNNNFDLGFFNLATVGNFVWHDLDADGFQDSNETGVEGVNVTLTQGSTQVATATTNSAGAYSFNVVPGTYTVNFTKPSGYGFISPTDNPLADDNLDSDGLAPAAFTVSSGETNNSIDLGLYNNATIGNYVWNDTDADGVQDSTELGITGVTVRLLRGTTEVATTATTSGGLYSFIVTPGDYTVLFVQPTDYNSVSPANSSATTDELDSDGLTVPVTIVSGAINNTIDQGFYSQAANVCVSIDMQGNTSTTGTHGNVRTFSAGGVSVNASAFSRTAAGTWNTAYLGSYGGGLGVTDPSEDGSGTTHTVDNTDRLNYVLFEFSHQVVVDAAFLGYVVTDSDITVWIGNVSNAFTSHQTLSDAFLSGLGFTEVNTTTSTSSRTADINAGGIRGNILVIAAQVDDTSPEDFFKIANLTVCVPAISGSASLGDFVWHDVNGNGLQDVDEPGIAGATVTLVGGGSDQLINGVGDTTTTVTTDMYGKYVFANLTPGNQYRVTFSLPSGYNAATTRKVGTDTSLDSDGLTSDVVVLASGESRSSIDAGFIKYVKVGNYVWNDLDKDGLQESGEAGIGGVQLTLAGISGSGASITQSTTTASNGFYQFASLPPGTYTVSVAASNFTGGGALVNYTASPTVVGSDRGLDSNAQPAPTTPGTLTSGGSDLTVDFGYSTTNMLACVTMKMEGNTAGSGSTGNIRAFSAGGISVKASAFARDSKGVWSTAYLGSFAGGLGVTDNSEGNGGNGTHTLDNVGRRNYILFEFSQAVTIDSAFLGYVMYDSDLTAWIGTATDPFNVHRNLSDSYLSALGYSENNDTTLSTSRTADLNAGNRSGNVLVISAATTGTQNDWFKIAELNLCGMVPASSAGTKFFVVDDNVDKTFKYTSAVQYTSNFSIGTTTPTGIAANPAGTNTWVSDSSGKIYKYDNNGLLSHSWSTGIAGTQGVSTNGTSIWTVSSSTDRVYFYSGAANSTSPTLTGSFRLNSYNTNPKDLATDGNVVWVVDDGSVDYVYIYTMSGGYLGRWQLDSANRTPTGITIDPSGGSKIWIVDSGTDRIYEYSGATGCRSGGMLAIKSYALNTGLGNSNPQGIADPPSGDGEPMFAVSDEALAASLLVDGSYVNYDVNPYYNLFNATDVNDDGLTTAIDALTIINRLNSGNAGKLSFDEVLSGTRLDLADVNNDGSVSPLDALLVINQLNQGVTQAVQPPEEQHAAEVPGAGAMASDQVFGDLGLVAEGELSGTFMLDSEFDLLRRRR